MRATLLTAGLAIASGAHAASAQTSSADAFALLDQAVERITAAAPDPDQRFAFTQVITADGDFRLKLLFDPNHPENLGLELVEPDEADLTKAQREFLSSINMEKPEDDVIVDQIADYAAGCTEVARETAEEIVFACVPPADEEDEEFEQVREHLSAEAVVRKADARLVGYRVFNTAPFKPVMVAKINTLNIDMTFEELGPDGLVVLTYMREEVAGTAMFQSFSQVVEVTTSDVTPVATPEPAPAASPAAP